MVVTGNGGAMSRTLPPLAARPGSEDSSSNRQPPGFHATAAATIATEQPAGAGSGAGSSLSPDRANRRGDPEASHDSLPKREGSVQAAPWEKPPLASQSREVAAANHSEVAVASSHRPPTGSDTGSPAQTGDVVGSLGPSGQPHPVSPALLKKFSSQCLRSSVWPSALDITPIGGYAPLGFGRRVLDTVLESHTLRVRCCAWNLHAKPPPGDLSSMLPAGRYHLYVVGSSECTHSIAASVVRRDKSKWEAAVRKAIGPGYTKLRSHALQAIHLIVFAHDDVLPLVSGVQSAAVPCGLANKLGNKGGVGIALTVGTTRCLFVSCHLAAHQKHIQHRNADYARIEALMDLPRGRVVLPAQGEGEQVPVSSLPQRRVSDEYDRVVFLGDMNYRINGTRVMIDTLLASRMHEVLLSNDQLSIERRRGRVFQGFSEGPLNFAPTYKFNANSKTYDTSKRRRIPAWTDRILFRSQSAGGITLLAYDSVDAIRSSDHRPVIAALEFQVNVGGAPESAPPLDAATAASRPEAIPKPTASTALGETHSQVCTVQ